MVWGVIALVVYDLIWELLECYRHLQPSYQSGLIQKFTPSGLDGLDDQTKALIGRFAVYLSLFTGVLPHCIALCFLLKLE